MMTVLLTCSTISSSRNYSSPSTGGLGNDSVKVAISDIRKANVKLVHRQISQGYGKLFTYTLINEEDL